MSMQEKLMDEVERFLMLFMSAAMNQIADFSAFSANALIELALKKENYRALFRDGGEATLKEFQKSLKAGEGFSSIRIEDGMTEDYLKFLNSEHVLYMALNDMENGTHCIVFRNRDLDKVNEIKNLAETKYYGKSEVDPKLFLKINEDNDIGYTGAEFSAEEVELIRHFMKDNSAVYSVVTDEKGASMVLFDPKDKAALQNAIYSADWILRGNFGPLVRKQLQYRIKGRQQVALDLEDARKEFYVLSKNNPKNYMHVTEEEVTYYKNNKEIPGMTMKRDNANFLAHSWDLFEGISSPVVLQSAEFFENVYKRQEVVSDRETLNMFPPEMIVEEEMHKYNKLRDLVGYKMGLDNEHQGDWALYVDSVPYSEFYGREEMLDEDQGQTRDYEKLQRSVKASGSQRGFNEMHLKDNSLDAIIERAQDKASGQNSHSREKEQQR